MEGSKRNIIIIFIIALFAILVGFGVYYGRSPKGESPAEGGLPSQESAEQDSSKEKEGIPVVKTPKPFVLTDVQLEILSKGGAVEAVKLVRELVKEVGVMSFTNCSSLAPIFRIKDKADFIIENKGDEDIVVKIRENSYPVPARSVKSFRANFQGGHMVGSECVSLSSKNNVLVLVED